MPRIVSRQTALKKGHTTYFTGEPCKYGHVSPRHTGKGFCYACNNTKAHKWHAKNPRSQQTPAWRDKLKIGALYKKAKELSIKTGIPHEVDHKIPMKGKTVSGLHVHQNLRIVTRHYNRMKHSKFQQRMAA